MTWTRQKTHGPLLVLKRNVSLKTCSPLSKFSTLLKLCRTFCIWRVRQKKISDRKRRNLCIRHHSDDFILFENNSFIVIYFEQPLGLSCYVFVYLYWLQTEIILLLSIYSFSKTVSPNRSFLIKNFYQTNQLPCKCLLRLCSLKDLSGL